MNNAMSRFFHQYAPVDTRMKIEQSAEIARQTQEFLEGGGQIRVIPSGLSDGVIPRWNGPLSESHQNVDRPRCWHCNFEKATTRYRPERGCSICDDCVEAREGLKR